MARKETDRIAEDDELFCTHIGGAATLEGVMMRGKKNWAVAVRREDGTMHVEEHDLPDPALRPGWMRWPIVRGCVSFYESMSLSYQAMQIAADHVYMDEAVVASGEVGAAATSSGTTEKAIAAADASACAAAASSENMTVNVKPAQTCERTLGQSQTDSTMPAPLTNEGARTNESASCTSAATFSPGSPATPGSPAVPDSPATPDSPAVPGSLAVPDQTEPLISPLEMLLSAGAGVALGLVLFVALPVTLANLLLGPITPANSLAWNLLEAAVRICILIAYVGGIALMPDVRRVYGYHGAEHQSIHCFEHGLPLTPQNAAKFSRLHVRCGTAFLVMTVAVAIVVHSVMPVATWADSLGIAGFARGLFVFATRLAMLPLVVGLSYEVTVKWAGSHPNNPLVKIALWPGLQMQRLTTRTADAGMLECAIEALKRVDARDRSGA